MCKILEKIINARLRWFLEHNKIIAHNQFGFRVGYSTTSHLASLETHIREAFANNQHVLAVSLDIEKTCDMIWRRQILNKLQEMGIGGNMWHFIKNFLHNRSIQIRFNSYLSHKTSIENGVPQGSVLSVTLFLIAINDSCRITELPVITRVFADDITILCKGKSVNTLQYFIQRALNKLYEWLKRNGLKFSTTKTECVLSSNYYQTHTPTLQLGTNTLRFVTCTKILGLLFDSRLT
ncbi:RNA-directed DNA polymerase from mobile element jockey [Anthophora retusa]